MASSDIQLSLDSNNRELINVSNSSIETIDESIISETKCLSASNGGAEGDSKKSFLNQDESNLEWSQPEISVLDVSSSHVSEELCINGLNPSDPDECVQNIASHPTQGNSETCSVAGDTQFQGEAVHANISHVYGSSCGNFHHTVPKVNYSHRVPSPNRRYSSPQSRGTSPCHQVVGNVNSVGNGQHIVLLHVNPGETISFHMGDHMQLIQGPATVPMVSSNTTPPIPMPVQVPPGHMVQQIVDENGTLRHIILSPQPPVAMPMGTPYNPAATPGTTNTSATAGASPFFVYPHPPFPPPAQFHPHMQGGLGSQGLHGHGGHLQPQTNNSHSHQGPSTAPSTSHANAHKDERTQRQILKLKKRLEGRQKDTFVFVPEVSPSTSPRKDFAGKKPKDKSIALDEDSDQRNSCEAEKTRLREILSTIKHPKVNEIAARSALIQWIHPDLSPETFPDLHVENLDFIYKIFLSDKCKDPRPKVIYSGNDLEYSLSDLKPASLYFVSIQCGVDETYGNASESVSFQTLPCEPDPPQPPKLISRTKTNLSLKWNASTDNGSKILNYILEYDEGRGEGSFVELFCGLQKQYKVSKLNASTCYRFRLAAVNEHGTSQYSYASCFSTSGSTPSQPQPPVLKHAQVNKLTLMWESRPNDDDFTLQMEDEATCHGFLPVYNGKDTAYTCSGLKRNNEYKFRICANNEEGSSPFSQPVCFTTLPDKPAPPGKPSLKGRAHTTSFKVTWEPPKDTGGSPVTEYNLEMDGGNGFESVYCGLDTEYQCELLQPGTAYSFQVKCCSNGGTSLHSETNTISTLPVVPGRCLPPRLLGKPKALSLHLKWVYPDYNGGSEILEFEIEMTNPDDSTRQAYKGTGTDCIVAGLHPGRQYKFRVRAHNKVGHGPWSDEMDVVSGAGTPDVPKHVQVNPRSSHSVVVMWEEPCSNGAVITEYCVESSQTEEEFEVAYVGLQTSVEVKSLVPSTLYYFRVQAVNSAGAGSFSNTVNCHTSPSSPGSISSSNIKAICGATTVALSWKEPVNNGAAIISYNIEVGDSVCVTEGDHPEICIEGLAPESSYKVRIQAVNSVGLGPFSSSLKVVTRGLPPCPPTLECCSYGHNSLRLKWGDGRNPDFIQYVLQMENHLTKNFFPVYQGTSHCHKITKLQETTAYTFRIYASNDEGDGPCSPIYTFTTLKALPPALKAPKVSCITETSCFIDWQTAKSIGSDTVSYKLTLSSKESDYQVVYAGTDTSFVILGLQPGTEYSVRVVALRHCSDGTGDLPGPFSPSSMFSTIHPASAKSNPPKMVSAVASLADRQPLTDQQWAIIILCGFTLFAIFVAILIQWILSDSRS